MERHFVTFYSPGTFVAEQTTRQIDSWNIELAQAMAREIKERYDAVPYGFRFTTRTREDDDFDSKETDRSGMYYINCRVMTLVDLEERNNPNEEILRSNMRSNDWDAVVITAEGWKWTQPLHPDDTVL